MCSVLHPDGQDPLKYLMRAFESYSKVGMRAARMLATRSILIAAIHQAAIGRHGAANQVTVTGLP